MFTHPDITAAIATERRRDMLAWADAHRLARATARQPRGSRGRAAAPRLAQVIRRMATRAAATTVRTA
jgi:hypothetical protein